MQRRHLVLGLALAATLAATAWFALEDDELAQAPRPAASTPRLTSTGGEAAADRPPADRPPPDASALQRTPVATDGSNPFASHDWTPPQVRRVAVAPPPPPPPAPKAPPLPFRYAGRLVEGGSTVVFLSTATTTFLAREGDVLDGQYRLDRIEPERVAFTYRPLAETQYLATGRQP